jgi:hypothetical protein
MVTTAISRTTAHSFAPMGARRFLIFGGIALVAGGLLFGDLFAIFLLHQNGARTGEALLAAAQAAAAQDSSAVNGAFQRIGGLLEDRGTKVDAHVHMTDAGYLALLLALVQPYVALSQLARKRLAQLFVLGGVLLPLGIFLIHYVGLAWSPFAVIGWASVLADSAGALLIAVLLIEGWGLWRYSRGLRSDDGDSENVVDNTWERRTLLSGGTILILMGFLYGAWYAAVDLYPHEQSEVRILHSLADKAAAGNAPGMQASVAEYGALSAARAVSIAAHSHIIEFGLLAILLAFIQPYVFLSESWRQRWVVTYLAGSVILPVFVWLELKIGLIAGGIADAGGLLVLVALTGMLVGVLRYTGRLDSSDGAVR